MIRRRKPGRAERRVLLALLTDATNLGGFTLGQVAQVNSGRVSLVLIRLLHGGLVSTEQETGQLGRPPRRFYRLTDKGERYATAALCLTLRPNGRDIHLCDDCRINYRAGR